MKRWRVWFGVGVVAVALVAGGMIAQAQDGDSGGSNDPAAGVITYTLPEGDVFRIAAQEGAQPENISAALDALAPGEDDEWLNVSPDGAWLLLSTDRFDPACAGWACLALLPADLSTVDPVLVADIGPIHSQGFSAVASSGALIVYPAQDGPHPLDLWALVRVDGAWQPPLLLTGDSPFGYHTYPAIAADGSRVVFDCGDEPYSNSVTTICTVNSDGSGFTTLLDVVPGQSSRHHPDFAPDGSIVYEDDDGGELIWRLVDGGRAVVSADTNNDNSPCVLPDGRIVSLWLGHPDNPPGFHEIKMMGPDGSDYFMLLTGIDVLDGGIGCGGAMGANDMANADVTQVRAVENADGAWTFYVTVEHPDTGWEDYADGWDVVLPDGTVLKPDADSPFTRLLLHPHVNEQPFTRSQSGIVIPDDVTQVTVRAHDIVDGWGGAAVTVDLSADTGPGFTVERVE